MRPTTEAEVAEIIAGRSDPLQVRGGGTRGIGRASAGEVLETGGLSGITLHDPGALTLVVRTGTPLAEVETALSAEGQRLPFEPMDHRPLLGTEGTPTIGGMVAANVSGPRRIQAGACRDFMLGVRFVSGTGEVVKNGGRVMKNVTGYDLVKLLTGSRGTLGVLTEVSLKVLPVPEASATISFAGLDMAEAVSVLARALGSPYEITGAAHDPGAERTLLRIEGFAKSVEYRSGRLAEMFAKHDPEIERDSERTAATWRDIRDVAPLHATKGDVWRISCKPSDAVSLAEKLKADTLLLDWGGGLIWATVPAGTDLRNVLRGTAGHATLVRSTASARDVPVFPPQPGPVAALAEGLRARFDPRGILNPGLMAC